MIEKEQKREKTFSSACQKLKEEVVKLYAPLFFFVRACLNEVLISIKREIAYERALKGLSTSQVIIPSKDVAYMALHSPLTLYTACEASRLMQAFNISKEEIIKYAFMTGGNVENMARLLLARKRLEQHDNLCTG